MQFHFMVNLYLKNPLMLTFVPGSVHGQNYLSVRGKLGAISQFSLT